MDEAISDFSQAISLDENYFWSWFNRGETFLQWGDHFAAIDDFQTAIDKRADHWSVFFKLGEAYYYTGDHQFRDEALAYLDQAVEMAPEEMLVRRVRADVLAWWFNDLEGALEELNIAVDLTEPGNPDAYISRGAVAKALGLFDLCIDDNNIAFEMTQDNMWIFLNRGDCYAELGDVDMARADYEMTIEMAGDNPEYEWFTSRIHEWLQAH